VYENVLSLGSLITSPYVRLVHRFDASLILQYLLVTYM
jgi:hypothetical protein